jgi:carboxyl-terminal processing protease
MKRLIRFAPPLTALGLILALATTGFTGLAAAPAPDTRATEANVTRLTTSILEDSQFGHHPFDGELATTLLNRYVDSLDPTRSILLQSDVDEFVARYRGTLSDATRRLGDASAAQAIYSRYLVRLGQEVSYLTAALGTLKFEFTGNDGYSYDREHAQRPADLAAARELWHQQLRAEYLQEKLEDKRPAEIVSVLTRRYARRLQTMNTLKSDEVLEIYLDALAHVYDPHSDYLGHEQMESLSIAMRLSLFGIGATLESADGYCKVRDLVPGGPAARSGLLKAGDRIVAVAQSRGAPVDIVDMPLSRVVDLIRGPKGSTVTLSVIPAGASDGSPPRRESIGRDEVKLEDQEARASIVDLPSGKGTVRLGVIDLPSFYADIGGISGANSRSATADVARVLAKLNAERVSGVVLDLRHNGGGSLAEAISLTGLFIRKGPVVQTRDQAGEIEVGADTDAGVAYDGPLVVLTSRMSASASEILTGALQDYGRAIAVGDSSTFGKGTVQTILPLARVMDQAHLPHGYDPGALKVTTNKFYRPSGASTQLRGVASDIVLPSTSDVSEISESALQDPLPWDTVRSTTYEHLNRVSPYVALLRDRSARRVAASKEFRFIEDDVARLKARLVTKFVSLNEAERRQELGQSMARREERVREERTLQAVRPTVYAITVENASLPGLPPPAMYPPKGSSTAPLSETDDLDEVSPDRSPTDDVILGESERILADYIEVLGSGHGEGGLARE